MTLHYVSTTAYNVRNNYRFLKVNLPIMAIVYFINEIVALETIQRRKLFKLFMERP